ncbi:MAG: ferritin-like domain-containing protein [Opitutaceae bacterium]
MNPVTTSPLEVAEILNLLLADEYLLYATTRSFCAQASASEFRILRRLFQQQHTQIAGWIDEIAAQARTIRVVARTKWTALTRLAPISAPRSMNMRPEHMLSELIAGHDEILIQLHADREACGGRLNAGSTAAFLETLIERHQQAVAELRSRCAPDEQKYRTLSRPELELQKA